MKARIEDSDSLVQNRGVIITSEAEEEREVLQDIWCRKGRAVMVSKLPDGSLELVIAPSADESEEPRITSYVIGETVTSPRIGYWFTYCCEEDLRQILSEDELAKVIENMYAGDLHVRCWRTKEEALAELKLKGGIDG